MTLDEIVVVNEAVQEWLGLWKPGQRCPCPDMSRVWNGCKCFSCGAEVGQPLEDETYNHRIEHRHLHTIPCPPWTWEIAGKVLEQKMCDLGTFRSGNTECRIYEGEEDEDKIVGYGDDATALYAILKACAELMKKEQEQ